MHRRTLLVALASLTAGCVSAPGTTVRDEFRLANLAVTTNTERPSARYVVEPSAYYTADAVERERQDSAEPIVVQNVSDIEDSAVREVVKEVLTDGVWRSNITPQGLRETVERVDFFTGYGGGDADAHIGLEFYELDPDAAPPIHFDATIVDDRVSADSPGALEFTLRNTGEEAQEVFSGTVPPFGVLRASRVDAAESFNFWRDYENEGCVFFGEQGIGVCSIGIITGMAPGEELTRRYVVLHPTTDRHPEYMAPPGPGRYRVAGSNTYNTGNQAPSSTLSYAVEFDLDAL